MSQTLENRVQHAGNLYVRGESGKRLNCAQAITVAYSDLVGLQKNQAISLAWGFGSGMGKNQTCGAVTAMLMVGGLSRKGEHCATMMDAFEKRVGSTVCSDIKGMDIPNRCPEMVKIAAELLNEYVFKEEA